MLPTEYTITYTWRPYAPCRITHVSFLRPQMKSKLALLGGPKTIKGKSPHLSWPPIDKNVEKAVIKQLHKGIFIYNRSGLFREFEEDFAKYYKRKHALLFTSGTLAIRTMFEAAGFKEGDEVICPVYTFFGTVSPLLHTGAKPILCDIDENGNIDPEEINKKITPRTKGIVVTHMWGFPCQMDEIVKICKKNNLLLLEDCSHTHGAKYKGNTVGSFGDLAAWSLGSDKVVSGGEGGVLCTNDAEFLYTALMFGHYADPCREGIPENHKFHKYKTTGMGLKFRPSPLAIAVAYEMFKRLEKLLKSRNSLVSRLITDLKDEPGISLSPAYFDAQIEPAWYTFNFQYRAEELGNLPIEKFFQALRAEGLNGVDIQLRSKCPLNLLPIFQTPDELFPIYKNSPFSYKPGDFPKAEKYYRNAVSLRLGLPQGAVKLINQYISGIRKVVRNFHDLVDK
jgi:perosamine synthetase